MTPPGHELMRYFCDPEIKESFAARRVWLFRLILRADSGAAVSLQNLHGIQRPYDLAPLFSPAIDGSRFMDRWLPPRCWANFGYGQEENLVKLLTDATYRPVFSFPQLETWHPGVGEGELAGGCLSLMIASLGTPYEIQTDGRILFLEDLGEPPYRIDRMLTQLRHAGKFENVQGIILGSFRECEPAPVGYSLKTF
jgi:hypothetical protein